MWRATTRASHEPRASMADAELQDLLARLALSHHLDAFLDEELSIPLLRTMGEPALVSNLQELGLTHVEADAMRRALNAPLEPTADAVELAVRWQSSTLVYRHGRDATVADLRSWLEAETDVPSARQKLLGWAGGKTPDDAAPLRTPARASLMLVGTPQREHLAAARALAQAPSAARAVVNDLGAAAPRRAPTAAIPGRRAARNTPAGRIDPGRGGGEWLDPTVWAAPAAAPPPQLVNPRSGRLERLDLSNALHAGASSSGRVGGRAADDEPVNVDITGAVRGACRCGACPEYRTRGRAAAASENDVEALRCARCGCQSWEHAFVGHDTG